MRDLTLDTHACVLMLSAPRKLGDGARKALEGVETGRAQAWLPAAVVAEIILLRGLGRTDIGLPDLRRAMEACPRLRFLPLDLDQLDEFAVLGALRDPFDRLIVAAARVKRARLVTRDGVIRDGPFVETTWD